MRISLYQIHMLLYAAYITFMHPNTTANYPRAEAAVHSSSWKWEECPRAGVPFQEPGDHKQVCHRDLAQGEKVTLNLFGKNYVLDWL